MPAKELGEYCLPITVFLNFLVRLTAQRQAKSLYFLLFQLKWNEVRGLILCWNMNQVLLPVVEGLPASPRNKLTFI